MSEIDYRDEAALKALVSDEFGSWSTTVKIDQTMIDTFAELTGDDMWLHVDVERCAKESPFATTIAHGFLVLSLLPKMKGKQGETHPLANVTGYSHMMNYGSDKLRFLGAVPVDSELHSRARIKDVEVAAHRTKIVMEQHVHIVGNDKPALIYELMFVYM